MPSLKIKCPQCDGSMEHDSNRCRKCSDINGRKHGHSHMLHRGGSSPTYRSWQAMLRRCLTPTNHVYKHYGGRGIKVCERWLKFENFLVDMGERPEGKTLDRWPDKNGNYEPGNCRWATQQEQMLNTRRNVIVVYGGHSLTLSQWALRLGVSFRTVWGRHRRGTWEKLMVQLGLSGPY